MPSILTALAMVAVMVLTACATSPLGRNQIMLVSNDQISEMGVASYRDIQSKTPASSNARNSAYVRCVANAITREAGGEWEVTLFAGKQVNAFALPGGKIGVYEGLLGVAKNQAQLSAVIGHEVAHVQASHSAERVSEAMLTQGVSQVAGAYSGYDPRVFQLAGNVFFNMPHSRKQESEADLIGLDLMANAGFDPAQAVELWQNMAQLGGSKPPELLSTHPADGTRIAQLTERQAVSRPLYDAARAAGKKPACG